MSETQAKWFELWMELWKLISNPTTPWVLSVILFLSRQSLAREVKELQTDLAKKNKQLSALEETITRLK